VWNCITTHFKRFNNLLAWALICGSENNKTYCYLTFSYIVMLQGKFEQFNNLLTWPHIHGSENNKIICDLNLWLYWTWFMTNLNSSIIDIDGPTYIITGCNGFHQMYREKLLKYDINCLSFFMLRRLKIYINVQPSY